MSFPLHFLLILVTLAAAVIATWLMDTYVVAAVLASMFYVSCVVLIIWAVTRIVKEWRKA